MSEVQHVAPFTASLPMAAVTAAERKTKPRATLIKNAGLVLGLAALVAIIMLPQPPGLSVAGQHLLGIFVFAVVVWMTEAVDYAASSVILLALMAFLLGTAPDPARPDHLLGTQAALSTALAGFTNSAVALGVVSLIGTSRSRILIGIIVVMALLAFFIPTASARVACLTPIALGMISALGIEKKSRVAGMLMMAIAYLSMIWAMGVATGAAQNVYANALMERTLHTSISWIDWLVVGAPFSAVMSVALYFVLMTMMAPTGENVPPVDKGSGAEARAQLGAALGPMTADEKKLVVLSVALLGFWATEGKLHSFDSSSVAVAAVALMFVPRIGVLDWKQVQSRIPWGILIQLG